MTRLLAIRSLPRELPPDVRVCTRCGIEWSCRPSSLIRACRDCRSIDTFAGAPGQGLRVPSGQEWRLLATDQECLEAHAAHQRGDRTDHVMHLQREYDRRGRARRREQAS